MFAAISAITMVATLLGIIVHYFAFGPRHPEVAKEARDTRRFRFWSVVVHAVVAISLLVLAGTGAVAVAKGDLVSGWLLFVHCAAAPVFAVSLTLLTLTWSEACRFKKHDWEWAKHCGGYLGGRQDLPADRFNAGQEAFFWVVALLGLAVILTGLGRMVPVLDATGQAALYQIHRYGALLLFLGFLVHLYLATLANPGTLLGIISGYVSAEWVKHHHPLWWERIRRAEKGEDADE